MTTYDIWAAVHAERRALATDTDLDLGEGPVVEGPAISVLLALCGRAVALGELSGPGVETLAGRI